MKKLLISLIVAISVLCSSLVLAEDSLMKFGFNDGSADMVYLAKQGKMVAGVGLTPITFLDGVLGLRVEYVNSLTGDMFDNDMLGLAAQVNIVKAVNLIPRAKWQLPDLGIKFSVGYMADIGNFGKGEPAIIISTVKMF